MKPRKREPEHKQTETKAKETDEEFVERMTRDYGKKARTASEVWRLKKIEQQRRIAILKAYKPKDPHAR